MRLTSAIAALSLVLTSTISHADNETDSGWGLGGSVSTLGVGFDVTIRLSDNFNARTAYRRADVSADFTNGDFRYEVEMDSKATLLALDWHPFASGFRVSGGAFLGGFDFTGISRCRQAFCRVGNGDYAGVIVGDVTLEAETGSRNPYIGIGYGNAAKTKGLGFSADLGMMFTTNQKVNLTSSNEGTTCSPITPCGQDVAAEEKRLEDEFEMYPFIGVGMTYTF